MRSVTIIALFLALSAVSAFNIRSLFGNHSRNATKNGNIPVALFHGIGDSCSNGGMQRLVNLFAKQLDTYAVCIESGSDIMSVFQSFEAQGQNACDAINKNDKLSGDFSVVGVSQGALIARAVLQKCNMKGAVKRFVSIGGPHMGVAGIPNCPLGMFPCNIIDFFVNYMYFWEISQQLVGPAGYYKDPSNLERYQKHSMFLADLNNEKPTKNPEYVRRWKNLDKVVLISFDQDMMIQPKETAHFEMLNSAGKLVPLADSDFYKSDYLGVRALNESGKITYLTYSGNHLHFSDQQVIDDMVPALRS